MSILNVILLAIVQGLAELLPVSSSAHVIVAEKLMGLDPSSPQMTLLLVMLHTGTMLAVIAFFWSAWQKTWFTHRAMGGRILGLLVLATLVTGVIGEGLIKLIESAIGGEVEQLFSRLDLIGPALGAAGILILFAGWRDRRPRSSVSIGFRESVLVGAVQGLSLPFRGFSRSGATISAAMLAGVQKWEAEEFSFALAVLVTPAAIGREILRLLHARPHVGPLMMVSVFGGACAFVAGMLALKWLTRWLVHGRWWVFGCYCLVAAAIVLFLNRLGY
jgi:undecaprenyl-diphosphatase